jgi:hypothetical protein
MEWTTWIMIVGALGFCYWLEDSISDIRDRVQRIEELLEEPNYRSNSE